MKAEKHIVRLCIGLTVSKSYSDIYYLWNLSLYLNLCVVCIVFHIILGYALMSFCTMAC
ncbi:hypothetical protein Scep_023896 [Stephania cephalantha]|uniref:Uncharacterized protein n=1 Tax=Stephania cephalantha TaxID=152367 RepID=A0AAP0EWM2_9MAGN